MQQDLFSQDFAPIRHTASHYVPVLQNKAGELEALRRASPDVWSHITPLINIVGPKKPRPNEVSVQISFEALRSWAKRLASAIGGRPFYLDILRLKPSTLLKSDNIEFKGRRRARRRQYVLEQFYEFAQQQRLDFVPVYRTDLGNETYTRIVRRAVTEIGRGFALRYPLLNTVSVLGPAELAIKIVSDMGEQTRNVDLILDLEYIPAEADLDFDLTQQLVSSLSDSASWRNVILLGTSIPSSMSCISEGSVGRIQRAEWALWKALRASGNPNLVFGDYGIQHPKPPAEGGPGMRANIRYTSEESTIVARGRQVLTEGKEEYRKLCRQLLRHDEYLGDDFSWGDSQIGACADGDTDPGSQNHWRAVGTSHHLAFVSGQLQSSSQESAS
ncbi:beta family protein [Hamadaea sp. NPDC050747]|uniref:beta family protein n=1 Tax=Hamadaea sp. NPDC050747 TaxID=3155789 RepID=UPI0034057852